ncbi:glycosyltransferase [Humibacillus xanthopallidus]|uniref:4,4'-diaponeurosporenoate glycosyltransferase n=1 Tax=Humibacillus xanthopallidus TaxID=412689 RepID=A0A543HUR3_9MICO|nr:glycosyltransferase [Humibacillus xanthopallidus]TQM62030.1 glycosyl transferase family 2 [Humibacillus xanthopallidus]
MRQLESAGPSGLTGVGDVIRAPGRADSICHITVVVPARNEERLIERCLDAVEQARRHLTHHRPDVSVEVVVVLDACTDRTAQLVARREGVTAVAVVVARVGAARHAGIREVTERGTHGGERAGRHLDDVAHWVANTDADTVVPPSWLLDQLVLAEHPTGGCDVVVGVALPDPAELTDDVLALWHDRHHLVEGHEHVHGANLAFRLSSYLDAGGFDPLPVHEDVRLVERMRARGARIVATALVRVRTSARTTGRAPRGFAAYLGDLRGGAAVVDVGRTRSGTPHVGCVAVAVAPPTTHHPEGPP